MTLVSLQQQVLRGASDPMAPGAAIAGLSVALIAGAYAFQYLGGLAPCPLCLEQRVPWYVLIAIGSAIAASHVLKAPRLVVLGLYAAAAAVAVWGAYLALFHAGVEYKWWPGPPDCTGSGLPSDIDISGPISRSEIVLCDEVAWSLFGISLAGFNFLFSLLAVALAAVGARAAFMERR
jgi:disulfide bond formation protein DsbB